MNLLICLIGPSLFGIKIFDKLNKNKMTIKDSALYYLMIIFSVNFLTSIVSTIFSQNKTSIDVTLTGYPIYAIKYIFIALFFSIIVPIIIQLVRKNISIQMKVVKDEK